MGNVTSSITGSGGTATIRTGGNGRELNFRDNPDEAFARIRARTQRLQRRDAAQREQERRDRMGRTQSRARARNRRQNEQRQQAATARRRSLNRTSRG